MRVKINMASTAEGVIAAPSRCTLIFEYSNKENRWIVDVDQLKLYQIMVLTQIVASLAHKEQQ